jgi:hypothetical protein
MSINNTPSKEKNITTRNMGKQIDAHGDCLTLISLRYLTTVSKYNFDSLKCVSSDFACALLN